MNSNRSFYVFLTVSMGIHCVVFSGLTLPYFFNPPQNKETTEFIYENPPEELKVKKITSEPKELNVEKLKVNSKIPAYAKAKIDKVENKNVKAVSLETPPLQLYEKKVVFIKKEDALLPKSMTNPHYIDYYDAVREKIKSMAYRNFSFKDEGEAFVTFVIQRSGQLKDIKVLDEKSSGSSQLKLIAKKSVRDASPFPEFPDDLDFPYLTFNVIISFEYN